jgi:hypothetical protein
MEIAGPVDSLVTVVFQGIVVTLDTADFLAILVIQDNPVIADIQVLVVIRATAVTLAIQELLVAIVNHLILALRLPMLIQGLEILDSIMLPSDLLLKSLQITIISPELMLALG